MMLYLHLLGNSDMGGLFIILDLKKKKSPFFEQFKIPSMMVYTDCPLERIFGMSVRDLMSYMN